MNERRNAAVVLAMCSWVKKRIGEVEERARAAADVSFPEEKTAGVLNNTVISYTQRVQKRPELKILNEAAFIDWVGWRWPTEVEPKVRDAWLTELRNRAIEHGALIDEHGEVCPHAELVEGTVYTMTKLTKDADAVLEPELSKLQLPTLVDYIQGLSES